MRRDKQWWAGLTKAERQWIVYAERNDYSYSCSYLPDGCTECGVCGQPQLGGGGMCLSCTKEYSRIVDKANGLREAAESKK